jgi:hypothetical protein
MWKADAVLPVQGPDGQKPSRPQLRVQQMSAKELALSHPPSRARSPAAAWQMVTWCQCRLKSPQKCRLKIPHFVAVPGELRDACHGARSRQGTRAEARAARGFIP